MSLYNIIAYSIGGALLLLMTLGIFFSIFAPAIDRWSRRYLIVLFSSQLFCVVTCFLDAIFYGSTGMETLEQVIYAFGFLSMLPLAFLPTLFLLHRCKESVKSSLLFKAVVGLSVLYFGLGIASFFADAFYSVTAEALFLRGPLFPLLISPLALIMLLNMVASIAKRKKLTKRYFIASMVYLPPLIATLVIHMFVFFEIFVLLGVGLWAITILALVLQENVERYMRQQREIASQRASILVLQMRPHFICNTMTSIYYLCDQDPEKAKQVTLDFTTYLRRNFAAIASEKRVPFSDELVHTRAYLSVEQAQFEDALFVSFDTPNTEFTLPPLTLQPIVENAVKHGMVESRTTIHISVRTYQADKANVILVEDDGPGFKPYSDDEPHIALNNIRQRLEMMCKGTLEIAPRQGGGTSVKVTIPFEGKEGA